MNHMTSVRLDDSVFVFVKVLFSVACTFLHPHLISYCAFFVLYCLYMATDAYLSVFCVFFCFFFLSVSSFCILWEASIVDLWVFWQPGCASAGVMNCRDIVFLSQINIFFFFFFFIRQPVVV